jgi:hypothetical protein
MDFELSISKDESAWDKFVHDSPQGSIYSDTRYLMSLGQQHVRYLVSDKNGDVLAGIAVMEKQDGDRIKMCEAPYPFTPYQGIIFNSNIAQLPNHKKISTEFGITEFLINTLTEHYGNFSVSLSPHFADIRPFLWHEYGNSSASKFSIKNRYTAILKTEGFNEGDYFMSIRSVRRNEFKKCKADIIESQDVEQFMALYKMTFSRQQILIDEHSLNMVRRIVEDGLKSGIATLMAASLKNCVVSMALFLSDGKRAYYEFGANNPEYRNSGASVKLMLLSIIKLANTGHQSIDFVGVNSPNRGDFKLSFNPELHPYYEVNLSV